MRKIALLLAFWFGTIAVSAQILTDSNLPILVIETDNGAPIPDEPKVLGTMRIIWHPDGARNYLTDLDSAQFLNYNGRIGIERRGSSSQQFQKKPYGFTTLQDDNVSNNNVSLLGLPEENDWVLNSLAYDQTGMRDALTYELSQQIGQYAPRWVYCEVMVNNDYKGLYVLMEKIKVDKNRVNIEKMDESCNQFPEVTGGYIVKADKTTGGDPVAWTMPGYGGGWWNPSTDFIHHYPKPDVITNAQHNYIHDVFLDLASKANSHNVSIHTGIPSVIDVPSFADFMMIAEFSSNVDVYSLSTFFHKDRNGKLRAGPVWDYNLAYGYDAFGNRSLYYVWQFDNSDNNGPRFWKDLFDTDLFRCYMAKRWNELTAFGQPLSYFYVNARINAIDQLITEAIGRDNQRWHNMEQHSYYVDQMKDWIQLRINWLNENIGAYEACDEVELPPLVISKIHYHPMDYWGISGDLLEFIEITNNGDEPIDLTGIYFRELGVSYGFPARSEIGPREALVLCSDSVAFKDYYNTEPFGQFTRNLSNKSENLVLVDAWGNVIDEVHYYDNDPWPWEADGDGPYLELIDLNLDNSLPENWTLGYDLTNVQETAENQLHVYPNPTKGILHVETRHSTSLPTNEYRIINLMGQTLLSGSLTAETNQIDVSQLSSGIYVMETHWDDGSLIRSKIIRE
jgi:hypothetical protein